jgi:hypothetical protein
MYFIIILFIWILVAAVEGFISGIAWKEAELSSSLNESKLSKELWKSLTEKRDL